jgi:hypothetical protein
VSTVATRAFASSPARAADETWAAIVEALTRGIDGSARDELRGVMGTAASLIADRAPAAAAIIVTCDGPRTRIRCVYDEDAIDGTGVNEQALGHDPLRGDWTVSLPCPSEDLAWVQASLAKQSGRITARDMSETTTPLTEASAGMGNGAFEIEVKGFLS